MTDADVYEWVVRITGNSDYAEADCSAEVESLIPLVTSAYSCLEDWETFTGNDAVLFAKGMAYLVINETEDDISELRNGGDTIKFRERASYVDRAWDYLSKISCVVTSAVSIDLFAIKGKRRSVRTQLGKTTDDPMYDLYTDDVREDQWYGNRTSDD